MKIKFNAELIKIVVSNDDDEQLYTLEANDIKVNFDSNKLNEEMLNMLKTFSK